MVIWKTIGVRIRTKQFHIKKIGGKLFRSFCNDCGEIPVAVWNDVTKKLEAVVNTRGRAYAARNRDSYRKGKS
jgi:hypothetical protein